MDTLKKEPVKGKYLNKGSKKTKKIIAIILIVVIVIPTIIYGLMFIDTNSVIDRASQNFLGEIDPDFDDPLYRYNYKYRTEKLGITVESLYLEIHRQFVWHNFFDGYIDVIYKYDYYDENGEMTYGGGGGGYSHDRWFIHKENWQWKVTKIIGYP